jgi:hypothetical protein
VAELSEYESKKIKSHIIITRLTLHLLTCPFIGPHIRRKLQEKIKDFQLHQETMETVSLLIRNAERCAVGERVCASCSRNSPVTESVFLDDLAIVMVRSGQARFVHGDEAITILEKYPGNPLIVASISGKVQEICRSYPKDCIYWNMKKNGFEF